MSFSSAFKIAALEQNTDEVFLWLLTIQHQESNTTFRLVNNLDDVVSRGETYMAFPFQFVLPEDDGETLPTIQISVDNVSLELIEIIRTYGTGITITSEIIMASAPDNVEYSIDDLSLVDATYNSQSITLTAQIQDLLNQRFPADDYLPRTFPGMFK